jgi:hypothetical protein
MDEERFQTFIAVMQDHGNRSGDHSLFERDLGRAVIAQRAAGSMNTGHRA